MTIHKCDKCGEELKNEPIQVGVGHFHRVELCDTCAQPVIEFLTSQQLLEERLQESGRITLIQTTPES